MTKFAVVSTTVPSEADARALARMLVEARLAACVQIMPVASVYRWNDGIEDARGHLLLCKIATTDFAAVAAEIRAHHTYDVPEIVATPLVDGFAQLPGLARGRGTAVRAAVNTS